MEKSTTMGLAVFVVFGLTLVGRGAAELGALDFQNRTARQMMICVENEQYPHNDFCCKNCDAGTYVKEKCKSDQEKGVCAQCEKGMYAEHPTGMDQCLQCSQCHSDQEVVQACTSISNTKCKCKSGSFCLPNEPCEVCKKCTRCKADEEVVKGCTSTSNTKCKRISFSTTEGPNAVSSQSNPSSGIIVAVVLVILFFVILGMLGFVCRRYQHRISDALKSRGIYCHDSEPGADLNEVKIPIDVVCPKTEEEQENNRNEQTEEQRPESHPLLTQETQETSKSIPVEDEDRGLGDSLPNTTSSSQTSLVPLPPPVCSSPQESPQAIRPTERNPEQWARDDCLTRKLIPVLGEKESLSKSFDLFDKLDVRYHNKFFRSIGVSDNHIKMAETQQAMDKVYELLQVWMQKEGLRANINTLLQALLDLNQRYTAENIASEAVEKGYYKYE